MVYQYYYLFYVIFTFYKAVTVKAPAFVTFII